MTKSKKKHDGLEAPYRAYAVSADGKRRLIHAERIVVDVGHAETEIELRVPSLVLVGQVGVVTHVDNLLVAGHGGGNGVHVGAEVRPRTRSRFP